MYRLKQLDGNEHPSDVLYPPLHPAEIDLSLLTPATKFIDSPPLDLLKAQPIPFSHLVTAGAIFHKDRLLLVQRSAADSYPGYWEIPAGSIDPADKSIRDALAREIREETGLTLKTVVQQVVPAETFNTGWDRKSKKWLKCVFIVEITEEAKVEAGEEIKAQEAKEKAEEVVAIETKKLVELMGDADKVLQNELEHAKSERTEGLANEIGVPVVKLNPKEHQFHLWATEEEVRNREVQGKKLDFICEAQVEALLNAFQLHKQNKADMAV
ncbi:NUDIX hydrolase domain-like protein [Delphinella strobiligena]|nr:NUDIX hydrolase domain-like protein [Delphinella strobiligena]